MPRPKQARRDLALGLTSAAELLWWVSLTDKMRRSRQQQKCWATYPGAIFLAGVWMILLLAGAMVRGQAAQATRPAQTATRPLSNQVQSILDDLVKDGDFTRARESLEGLFTRAAFAETSPTELSHLIVALTAVRQLAQFNPANPPGEEKGGSEKPAVMTPPARPLQKPSQASTQASPAVTLLQFLRASPSLWTTLPLLVQEGKESSAGVYQVLHELRLVRGAALERFAELTAAICVVYDERPRRVSPGMPLPPGPVEIFDFFTVHAKDMIFRPDALPAELLIYLVDAEATVPELLWALDHFRGNPQVGLRFFEVPYDLEHYLLDAPKRIDLADRTLQNILELGGTCGEQAYFAAQVGKAVGVPAVVVTGASARSSHAWVGYLQSDGQLVRWNFDSGRYPEFRGLRGHVFDPQIRKQIPDGHVALLAALLPARTADQHLAAVWTEAARLLLEKQPPSSEPGPVPAASVSPPPNRPATNYSSARPAKPAGPPNSRQRALQWLESAILHCPGYLPAWLTVSSMAPYLTREDKEYWFRLLDRVCGSDYPDFTWTFLAPLVQSEPDLGRQAWIWDRCAVMFQSRPDLAAAAGLEQGKMWERAREPARAWACYEDVVRRFANAGPFVVLALERLEQLLPEEDSGRVLALYNAAWSLVERPGLRARLDDSNWFQIGRMYADRLEKGGWPDRAWAIRNQIGQKPAERQE
jgi:hypothetical protein